jgi:hypothetical protein
LIALSAAFPVLTVASVLSPALAGEYCINDSSIFRGCGYETLAQCQATTAGTGGTCVRNPRYPNSTTSLAYSPKRNQARNKHSVE